MRAGEACFKSFSKRHAPPPNPHDIHKGYRYNLVFPNPAAPQSLVGLVGAAQMDISGDRVFSLCYNVPNVIGKGQGRRHCMPNTEKDKRPIVARITVGIFQENCYLYACPQTLEAVIIDPGDEAGRILKRIEELKLIPKYILNTHGHIDHIRAIDAISAVYPVPLAIHPDDVYMYTEEHVARRYGLSAPLVQRKPDILLKDGDRISFGTLTLEVLYTPGHTPGGVCFLSTPYCVFTGDTLFQRSIGRTDFEGGNYEQLITSIREKLYTLDENLVAFPGHGDPTTILEEKHENPFVNVEE